jgi:hypothetical protein
LIIILKSGELSKQIYAAKALGNIGQNSKAATEALIKELTKNWVIRINEELEYNIVFSLGKIGGTTNINSYNPFIKKFILYIKKGQNYEFNYYNDSIKKITKQSP